MLLGIKLRVDGISENLHHMSKCVLGLMLFFIALIVSTGVASATIITGESSFGADYVRVFAWPTAEY